MSVNFSTITQMNQATISRKPAFSTESQQQQPSASSPMNSDGTPKKKSHWFAKTLGTLVVLATAVGLGRKYLPNTFNPQAALAGTENLFQKGLHYAKVGIGHAGEFVNTNLSKAYAWAKNLIKPTTPTP